MINRRASLWHAEDGGPAIDAVEIISALLVLILGIIELGTIYWSWNTMLLAVQEAGRYAMLYNPTAYPGGPPSQTCSASPATVGNCAVAWANQNGGNVFGTVSCTNNCTGTSGQTITFTSQYSFNFIFPVTIYRVMTFPLV